MRLGKHNKIILEKDEIAFIKANWESMTNPELAKALGLKLTKLRDFLREMGLKRIELEYWTANQVKFLKQHYKEIGDTELAEIFEIKWHKEKGWTKKHIEKKRRYLKLKRSVEERKKINERNILMGRFKVCNQKMWKKRGVTPVGEKRVWFKPNDKPLVVIKTKTGFEHYNRYLWEKYFGPIPEGMNVRIMSDDKINFTKNDLILITNAENSKLNSQNRLPEDLKTTIKLVNKLNRILTQK